MEKSVLIQFDVDCQWDQDPPRYRLYVNDELFTERTWIWRDEFLQESIALSAVPGQYQVRYELLGQGQITISNAEVLEGPACFADSNLLIIS